MTDEKSQPIPGQIDLDGNTLQNLAEAVDALQEAKKKREAAAIPKRLASRFSVSTIYRGKLFYVGAEDINFHLPADRPTTDEELAYIYQSAEELPEPERLAEIEAAVDAAIQEEITAPHAKSTTPDKIIVPMDEMTAKIFSGKANDGQEHLVSVGKDADKVTELYVSFLLAVSRATKAEELPAIEAFDLFTLCALFAIAYQKQAEAARQGRLMESIFPMQITARQIAKLIYQKKDPGKYVSTVTESIIRLFLTSVQIDNEAAARARNLPVYRKELFHLVEGKVVQHLAIIDGQRVHTYIELTAWPPFFKYLLESSNQYRTYDAAALLKGNASQKDKASQKDRVNLTGNAAALFFACLKWANQVNNETAPGKWSKPRTVATLCASAGIAYEQRHEARYKKQINDALARIQAAGEIKRHTYKPGAGYCLMPKGYKK